MGPSYSGGRPLEGVVTFQVFNRGLPHPQISDAHTETHYHYMLLKFTVACFLGHLSVDLDAEFLKTEGCKLVYPTQASMAVAASISRSFETSEIFNCRKLAPARPGPEGEEVGRGDRERPPCDDGRGL